MVADKNSGKPKLGLIGAGRMGSRMAQKLIAAGYRLSIYDRTKEKARALQKLGAAASDTPRELAGQSDILLVSVTDDAAQINAMFSQDGAVAGLRKGSIIIDLSTVSPDASRRLYNAARAKGGSMIDAAVSGSLPQVEQGILVIFVGGDRDIYEQCRPVLANLGKSIFYMGSSGMGTTMKLVVNTFLGLGMQALAEAIALGEKSGLDKGLLLEVLDSTAVLSAGQKAKLVNVKNDEYPVQFSLPLMHKDFGLILKQAAEVSVPMPATAASQQMFTAAMAKGADEDFSIAVKFMRELAGISDRK